MLENNEKIGLVTMLSTEQIKIWMMSRIDVIDLHKVEFEVKCKVGDWISVFFDESKCAEDQHYILKMPSNPSILPEVLPVNDSSKILVHVNFVPMEEFLYPRSSVEKNLRMCHTFELGNVPLVFANTFKPYCAYAGKAIISLNKDSIENNLEKVYETPWLIYKKDAPEFTSEEKLGMNLRKASGLIIKRDGTNFFLVYSPTYGFIRINEASCKEVDVGDFVGFFLAEIKENDLCIRIGISARKIQFPHHSICNSEGTVDIIHEITVGDRPRFNDTYTVPKLGSVRDAHALITKPNCTLKVRSRCTLTPVGVNFDIVEVIHNENEGTRPGSTPLSKPTASASKAATQYHTPKKPFSPVGHKKKERPELRAGAVVSLALVFAKTLEDSVLIYTNDRVVFRNNVTQLTSREIDPLPEVGDFLEIQSFSYNRKYDMEWVGKKEVQPFATRLVDGILNVRVSTPITGGFNANLYHNFFGAIENTDNRVTLPQDKLTTKNVVHIWIKKINGVGGNDWAVTSDPEPDIEAKSPLAQGPINAPAMFVGYIGPKYGGMKTRFPKAGTPKPADSPRDNAPDSGQQSTLVQSSSAPVRSSPVPIPKLSEVRATPNRRSPADRSASRTPRRYSPRGKKPCSKSDVNLERITQEHYDEYFPELRGRMPESFANYENSPKPQRETTSSPYENQHVNSYSDTYLDPKEEERERVEESWPEDFVARYPMNGVAVSKCSNGVYIYTNSNPDKEALLTSDVMDDVVKHGDWINFEARFSHNRYIVVSYIKRPPICETRPIRNTVELRITDAFVPSFFGTIDDIDARVLTSSFLSAIADPKNVVRDDLRGRILEVVAQRCKLPYSNSTVNWQLTRILRIVE